MQNALAPTYAKNGFYLEDSIVGPQYTGCDVPSLKTRQTLSEGDCAQLVFRFAPENAERHESEIERHFVRISELTSDGGYIGCVTNDSKRLDKLKQGGAVVFYPDHIISLC